MTQEQLIDPATPELHRIEAAAIIDAVNLQARRTARSHRRIFRRLWHNDHGLTPDQILAAMGPAAKMVFIAGGANVDMLAGVAAAGGKSLSMFLAPEDYIPPRPYTIHQDGTVTLQ